MPAVRTRFAPVLVLTVLLAAACGSSGDTGVDTAAFPPTPTTATAPPDRSEEPAVGLEADLSVIIADTGVPGLGAAVFDDSGVTVAAVVGNRSRGGTAAIALHDPFHLGSNTKAMTAALLGVLGQNQAGVSFDTTLEAAFPGLDSMHADYRGVTLGELMSHTGGTPAHTPDRGAEFFDLPLVAQRAGAAELVLSEPPEVRPGLVSHYSNIGYVVAAAAMEAATGQSWEELITTELFEPLGMTSCGFGPPGSPDALDAPRGHDDTGEPVYGDNPAVLAPAGGVHCALADWAAFLTELLNASNGGSELITPETASRLLSPDAAVPTDTAGVAAAMGWGVLEGPDGLVYLHSGSNGAWFSQAVLAPGLGQGVIGVTNSGPDGETAVSIALDRLTSLYPAVGPIDETNPVEQLTGYYWSNGTDTFICANLAESSPPQCAGNAVPVSPDHLPEGVELRRSNGIEWTDTTVTVELPTAG